MPDNKINLSLVSLFKKPAIIDTELLILSLFNYILINIAPLVILLVVDINLSIDLLLTLSLYLIFINIISLISNADNIVIKLVLY